MSIALVEGMESDPEVEKLAVDVVMQYEADQGRKPVSVEEENCGWDITSLHGGQVARYIEVKGRAGEGGVALTSNEWIKAQRFGQEYWLYVVVNCKANSQLSLIQDPASKLHPISIPHHSTTLKPGTARNILDQLEKDIDDLEELLQD